MLDRIKNLDLIQGRGRGTSGRETLLVHGRNYTVLRQIGEGTNSIVYLCQAGVGQGGSGDDLPAEVAVKRIIVPRSFVNKVHEEMDLLASLRHRNIVRCYGSEIAGVQGQHCVSMVLEHCPRTLIQRMMSMSSERKFFDEDTVLLIVASIAAAVSYLHSQTPPIAHRDLKPENLLVSERGDFKLCDFGSATRTACVCQGQRDAARIREDVDEMTTLAYRAPEMVDPWRRDRIDEKTDVWALGVFLYYVMYFQFPFAETSLAILSGKFEFPSEPSYSAALHNAVRQCLRQRPSERWSVFDLCAHLQRVAAAPQQAQLQKVVQGFVFPPTSSPTALEERQQPLCASLDTPTTMSGGAGEYLIDSPNSKTAQGGGTKPPAESSASAVGGGDLFAMLDWGGATSAPQNNSPITHTAEHSQQQQSAAPERTGAKGAVSLDDALFGGAPPTTSTTALAQPALPPPQQHPHQQQQQHTFDPFGSSFPSQQQQPQLQQLQTNNSGGGGSGVDLFSATDWGAPQFGANSVATATSGNAGSQNTGNQKVNLDDIFA